MTSARSRARAKPARLISDRISQLTATEQKSSSDEPDATADDVAAISGELVQEIEAKLLSGRKRLGRVEVGHRLPWLARLDAIGVQAIEAALEATLAGITADGVLPDEPSRELRAAVGIRNAARAAASCRATIARGVCTDLGHEFASVLSCGRSGCGCAGLADDRTDDRGPVLSRRMSRARPKLAWAAVQAYVVVSVPPERRDRFRSREGLADLHAITATIAKILRPDAPGCMTVNHEFGDRSPKWLPHGNAVIPLPPIQPNGKPTRWKVPKKRLLEARVALARMLDIDEGRANLHYAYVPERKRDHLLRYVLRDTSYPHRDEISDADMLLLFGELHGFRRVRYHGDLSDRKWKAFAALPVVQAGRARDEQAQAEARARKGQSAQREATLEENTCPCCSGPIEWRRQRCADLAPKTVVPPVVEIDGVLVEPENGEPFVVNEWKQIGWSGTFHASLATWEQMQEREPEGDPSG